MQNDGRFYFPEYWTLARRVDLLSSYSCVVLPYCNLDRLVILSPQGLDMDRRHGEKLFLGRKRSTMPGTDEPSGVNLVCELEHPLLGADCSFTRGTL